MRKFDFEIRDDLPPLAWLAIFAKGAPCRVLCGRDVETADDAFFEGAWNGSFSEKRFDDADFFCGSGGRIVENGWLLATPSHILDKIVAVEKDGELFASNSVPLALAASGARLDPEYERYEKDFSSIIDGLDGYVKNVRLADGAELRCYYYCNVLIDDDLRLNVAEKRPVADVDDYADYYESLLRDLTALKENAQHESRKKKYGVATTVSSGYDAPACAVLAKKIGADVALTFDAPEKYRSDCGDEIAEALGYKTIVKKDANEYLRRDDLTEAEYVCSGDLGSTIVFSAFEDEFRDNLVFFGEFGDKIWDKNWPTPNNRFDFNVGMVGPGIATTEARLRVGFIFVLPAFWRAAAWPSIHRMGASDAMKHWSLGERYDRPIPRRIVESAGVPREIFGRVKRGAGFNYRFDNLSYMRTRMSPTSFASFRRFLKTNKRKKSVLGKTIRFYASLLRLWALPLALRKIGVKAKLDKDALAKLENPGAPTYLTAWGTTIMTQRYAEVLAAKR